jgi:hypothetical protein
MRSLAAAIGLSVLPLACNGGAAATPTPNPMDASVVGPDTGAVRDSGKPDVRTPSDSSDGPSDSAKTTDSAKPDAPAMVPGVFVAVGYGGRRIRSADGMTWTHDVFIEASGGDDDDLLRAVSYGGKQFVALGWRVMTSPDGITWDDHGPMSQWFGGLAWGRGIWVAVGGYGRRSTSPDGITWTDATDSETGAYRSLAFGDFAGGTWLAMGDGGRISTTTDGLNYTELTALALVGATWGPSGFVGIVGANLESSADGGVSWTVVGTAPGTLESVIYANGQYVAVGSGNSLTSPDGTTWTPHPEAQLGGSIAYGDGLYATCGGNSCSTCCWYSKDGAAWTTATVPSGDSNALQSVAFGSN